MAEINLRETFKRNGISIAVTSAVLRDPTGLIGIKRDDTDEVLVVAGTVMTEADTGVYTYSFDEPTGETGLTYTYWVEWVYLGRTYRDEHTVTGSTENDITPTRSMDKYVDWIKREFNPLQLIIAQSSDEVIEQQVENAIRYWNTHSAYKISQVVDYSANSARVQLDPEFKAVVDVLPTAASTYIWSSHPLWTLVGLTVLDNVTSDLIMMSEAFRSYQIYVGTNFRFAYKRSDEPTIGGYLYCTNVPANTQSLLAIGTKRITKNEDIKSQYILDWILYYAKALVKQLEGNVLRKTMIIDTPLDGQSLVDEGRKEIEQLQERLHRDSRWIIFMKRK